MNPLYRAILLFYALFGLLAAFVIYAFILGVPWPRALVNNLLHLQNANSIISLSLIIYVLFSLVLIWIGLKREKKKHAVVSEGSLGNIRVALNAFEKVVDVARATGANRSSMLQDMDRGKPTEIDYINGAVVREGKRLGIPTPCNSIITMLVKALEEKNLRKTIGS